MINWKRRSNQSLSHENIIPEQQSNSLIEKQQPNFRRPAPIRALPPHPDNTLSVTEEVDNESGISNLSCMDPKECATRLWHEDESFVQREQIAEWLGQRYNMHSHS